ncbi:MAG: DNA alkylation repair protein [Myxococcota bacterium]
MNEAIGSALEAQADDRTARQLGKQIQCLRGIRGVAAGTVARVAAEAWRTHRPRLPDAAEALNATFGQAHEDGLVAVGLLAAAWPDDPDLALDLGLDWGDRLDDIMTADALGWLVLGPIGLQTGTWIEIRDELAGHRRPQGRRTVVAMGLAACPVPVEGPAAAPLREKVGTRKVQMVDAVQAGPVQAVLDRMIRDPHAMVQKALRRLVRAFGDHAPKAAVEWADGVKGGLPRLIGDEIRRARRHAARRAESENLHD